MNVDPWNQQPGEPDEAYAAFLRDRSRSGHKEATDQAMLERLSTPEEIGWYSQWSWEARHAAWDAEAHRRRNLRMADLLQGAATQLVESVYAALFLQNSDDGLEELHKDDIADKFKSAAEALKTAFEVHSGAVEMTQKLSALPVVQASADRDAPKTRKPRNTSPKNKTKQQTPRVPAPSPGEPAQVPDVPSPASSPTAAPKQYETRPKPSAEFQDLPTDEPTFEPDVSPHAQAKPQTSSSPSDNKPAQTEDGLLPPTIGPGCARGAGIRYHKERGERLCENCAAKRQSAKEATQKRKTRQQEKSPAEGGPTQYVQHVAPTPVMLRPAAGPET